MDQASEDKAISLHLQDVQALLDQENVDDEEGEISDQRIAMQTYHEHLRQRLTSLQDSRIARSFATAVQSDDNILGAVYEQEQVAYNDRVLARRLAGVTRPDGPAEFCPRLDLHDAELADLAKFNRTEPVLPNLPTTVTSVDTACEVQENRGTKRRQEDALGEDNGGRSKRSKGEATNTTVVLGSKRKRSPNAQSQAEVLPLATSVASSLGSAEAGEDSMTSTKRVRTSTLDERVTEEQIACISCSELCSGAHLSLRTCEHSYCSECVSPWVAASLDPGSSFPPVCCGVKIALELLEPHISLDLARRFKKQEQASLAAACPLVCAEPGCLVGISAQNIVDNKGHCLACKRFTCSKCRMGWHEDKECLIDEEQELVMALAKKEGWQSCFHCGNLVELNFGCYHMT